MALLKACEADETLIERSQRHHIATGAVQTDPDAFLALRWRELNDILQAFPGTWYSLCVESSDTTECGKLGREPCPHPTQPFRSKACEPSEKTTRSSGGRAASFAASSFEKPLVGSTCVLTLSTLGSSAAVRGSGVLRLMSTGASNRLIKGCVSLNLRRRSQSPPRPSLPTEWLPRSRGKV